MGCSTVSPLPRTHGCQPGARAGRLALNVRKNKKPGSAAAPFIDLHRICDTIRGVADSEGRIISKFCSVNTGLGASDDRTSQQVFFPEDSERAKFVKGHT